ncbi:MAG: 3-phosphoserine/phosphohydroxythreonine transaminase [Phycisphaerales bacterium]|nr:3-phosphoserine/phosphohydroxythreonine transaminase [Phycisphaerales bacterium]
MTPSTTIESITRSTLNFSAGPAILPECVLQQASKDVLELDGTGISVLEHSHRSPSIDRVFEEAEASCRAVGDIPDSFKVLFLQGGASMQFGMLPLNFLPDGRTADYVDTGSWTSKAIKDASCVGQVHTAWSGKDGGYRHIPDRTEIKWSDDPAYACYCTNNTIYGTRWNTPPSSKAPLIADMSSDIFSRPIDWSAHSMVYAGAQKNIGPAGVTVVIIHEDLLAQCNANLPTMLRYDIHADKGSRYNTPPVFAVYCAGLVFKWILDCGGLAAMERHNEDKAGIIYNAIDDSDGFYTPHADSDCRSTMNIPFTTPSPELDAKFIAEATAQDMHNLKGHRSVGGIRASIYNAFPEQGCIRLGNFMAEFATAHRKA